MVLAMLAGTVRTAYKVVVGTGKSNDSVANAVTIDSATPAAAQLCGV